MPFTTIEPRRLYRQVADQLRQLIDAGEFMEGGRLPPERELAVKLGVSRPTVREALIALEVDGRVRIRVGSGVYVLPPPCTAQAHVHSTPIAGPFEVLEARALFEGAIAAAAADAATTEGIARIDEAIAQLRSAQSPGSEAIAADRAFHAAVAAILANDAITEVVCDLFDQRSHPHFAQLAHHFENSDSWRAAHSEHQAIRDRVASGDAEGARAAMMTHLRNSGSRFSQAIGEVSAGSGVAPFLPARQPSKSGALTPVKKTQHLELKNRRRRQ